MSPPTRTVFDFTKHTHVPGAWFVFDPEVGLDAFACPAAPTEGGIGGGCFVPDGAYGVSAAAAFEGRLQVCGTAMGGCSEAIAYTRVDHCAGIGGNVFIDEAGARVGHARAIRAEEYKTETLPWLVTFQHDDLPFAENHAYRFTFWARAAAPRQVLLTVGPSDASHTEYLFVDTEWREYATDFMATDTDLGGSLGFYLGIDEDGTTLWLDSITLTDLGPDACNSNESNPVRGGEFTYGAACWERSQSTLDHYSALTTDPDAPVDAPSLRVDQRGATKDSVAYIAQRDLPVEAGHAYDLSFAARAASPRPLEVIFTADNPLSVTMQVQRALATTWQTHRLRFIADPDQGSGNALLMFMFGQGGTATTWLDDVHLTRDLPQDGREPQCRALHRPRWCGHHGRLARRRARVPDPVTVGSDRSTTRPWAPSTSIRYERTLARTLIRGRPDGVRLPANANPRIVTGPGDELSCVGLLSHESSVAPWLVSSPPARRS